ncbi:MAG: hypothetical protein U9P38_07140, partial [Campylobacterota bacterium]|nr:hypothetical protein [Campylobacterota bacterium]
MLNIDNIFNNQKLETIDNLESGISILDDLTIWIDRFNSYLLNIDASKNTIISYNIVLKALYQYCEIYISSIEGISYFNELHTNDFLLWMENYRTNRDYGSLKNRVGELLNFIVFSQKDKSSDIFQLRNRYIELLDNAKSQQLNFILDEFEDYFFQNEIEIN